MDAKNKEMSHIPEREYIREYIHEYFGLSYANYLVVPRVVLQSMPEEWQRQFVELLGAMGDSIAEEWEPEGGYHVEARTSSGQITIDPYSDYERGWRRLPRKGSKCDPHIPQQPLSVRKRAEI